MSRYVSIPARPAFPEAQLSYPTVVLLPTTWTDSFFFYPQFDDPTFFEHFNLVAIDFRGFGSSRSGAMQDQYSWEAVADDVHVVMTALDIPSAHFIAVVYASLAGLSFASRYPCMTDSLCIITPPQREEPFTWTIAFKECAELMESALEEGDLESMDDLTTAAWEFAAGGFQSPALSEFRNETMGMARNKLLNGDMALAAPWLFCLLANRLNTLDKSIGTHIQCPLLVLYGTEDCQAPDEDDTLITDVNANPHSDARAALHVLEGLPKWMTLTSPDIVNPILTSFISAPKNAPLPMTPESPTCNRSMARRPSTPRSMSGLLTPLSPLRNVPGGSVTSPARSSDTSKEDTLAGASEGVRMTVEVTIVSDS